MYQAYVETVGLYLLFIYPFGVCFQTAYISLVNQGNLYENAPKCMRNRDVATRLQKLLSHLRFHIFRDADFQMKRIDMTSPLLGPVAMMMK